MISFAKIIGDLIGGFAVHIAGGVFACIVASEAYHTLAAAATPIAATLK